MGGGEQGCCLVQGAVWLRVRARAQRGAMQRAMPMCAPHKALAVPLAHTRTRPQVVLPPVEPHDPEAGILCDPSSPPCLLPHTHAEFIARRAQLVAPQPTRQLQADRTYPVDVVVPGEWGWLYLKLSLKWGFRPQV